MNKIVALVYFTLIIKTSAFDFNCELPIGCEVNDIHYQVNYLGNEKTAIQIQGIICNVRDKNFQFNYSKPSPLIDRCKIYNEREKQTIEIRFQRDFIFGNWFNTNNMLNYGRLFKENFNFNFVNLNGFQIDIIDNNFKQSVRNLTTDYFYYFNCIRCNIAFYSNDRQIKTCEEITNTINQNNVSIMSLFQFSNSIKGPILTLFDPHLKSTICPLMFKNSLFLNLNLIGLSDTFYKRNVVTFENRIFDDLKSTITVFQIKGENINIDSNLINPSVFKKTKEIHLYGNVNNIDGRSLNELKRVYNIIFSKEHFRDMVHKNGIKWMRDLNPNLNLNLSSLKEIRNYYGLATMIKVYCTSYIPEIRLSKVFPEEDFCLYKDFPFNQLVILMEYAEGEELYNLLQTRDYTCTYLWLAQYFDKFFQFEK